MDDFISSESNTWNICLRRLKRWDRIVAIGGRSYDNDDTDSTGEYEYGHYSVPINPSHVNHGNPRSLDKEAEPGKV